MNIPAFQQKIDDVIKTLSVYQSEVREIESQRKALEQSQLVNTQREQKIALRELAATKKETDCTAQQTYIENMNKNTSAVLVKIAEEKKVLQEYVNQKRTIEQERLQLEADKKGLEGLRGEKETLRIEKNKLEEERRLFSEEKRAIAEQTKLMALKEQHIKAKEEKLDRIERMTAV